MDFAKAIPIKHKECRRQFKKLYLTQIDIILGFM